MRVLAMLLATVIVVAGTASGEREEGDDVLVQGEHLAVAIELAEGEEVEIRIFVVVSDGPLIDVFWMSEEGYEDYQYDQDFDHYVDYTIVGTKETDKTFTWDGEGVYFVVFDNTASETVPPADPAFANATIRYVVTWGPVEGLTSRDYAVYSIIAIAALFVVFLAIRYAMLRRGSS